MEKQTQKDYLTGFGLRDSFYASLEHLIIESKLNNKIFSLVLLDLDRFKKYNDKFGHLLGDEILKHVAGILHLFFRDDLCFRFGGDEFIALLPEKNSRDAFQILLKLKKQMINSPFLFEGKSYNPFRIGFSCGIVEFPGDGRKIEDLIKKADQAMYLSKKLGHNLITSASRIKYIKFRHVFLMGFILFFVFVTLGTAYQYFLKQIVQEIVHTIRNVRISAEPRETDIIMLKNGSIIRGEISEETEKNLMLTIRLKAGERGKVSLVLEKSEIAKIKYGSR